MSFEINMQGGSQAPVSPAVEVPTLSLTQPSQMASSVVPTPSSSLKYFFIIGGILLVAGAGFGGWKYQQMKNRLAESLLKNVDTSIVATSSELTSGSSTVNIEYLLPEESTPKLKDSGVLNIYPKEMIKDVYVSNVYKNGKDVIVEGSGFLHLNRGAEVEQSTCSIYNNKDISVSSSDTEIILKNYVPCLPNNKNNYVVFGRYDGSYNPTSDVAKNSIYNNIYKDLGGTSNLERVEVYNRYLISSTTLVTSQVKEDIKVSGSLTIEDKITFTEKQLTAFKSDMTQLYLKYQSQDKNVEPTKSNYIKEMDAIFLKDLAVSEVSKNPGILLYPEIAQIVSDIRNGVVSTSNTQDSKISLNMVLINLKDKKNLTAFPTKSIDSIKSGEGLSTWWESENADTASLQGSIESCPDATQNIKFPLTDKSTSGEESDIIPTKYAGCKMILTFTVKNTKTGEQKSLTKTITIVK